MSSGATVTSPGVRSGSLAAWVAVARPRSLLVAVSPVLVGTAVGYERTGAVDPVAALLALGGALLVQLVSNMQNDVGYTARGGELRATRTGLPRATANGWLTLRQVRIGIAVASLVALAIGVALVAYRGWPVLLVGGASLLAGLAYMGGPMPIAYTPLGELTVFVFFGLVAVIGTDWVVSGSVGALTVVASMSIGCLAAAALCVNNHRDVAHDRSVGRRTFAVTFGVRGSRGLYAALLLLAFAFVPVMATTARGVAAIGEPGRRFAWTMLLPLVLVPASLRLWRDFTMCAPGIAFNAILFRTFRLELAFAVLLSIGCVLARSVR